MEYLSFLRYLVLGRGREVEQEKTERSEANGRFDENLLDDGTGKILATYDAGDNRTRDGSGRIVGHGDLRLFRFGKDWPTK
jgi:hypothetical protein